MGSHNSYRATLPRMESHNSYRATFPRMEAHNPYKAIPVPPEDSPSELKQGDSLYRCLVLHFPHPAPEPLCLHRFLLLAPPCLYHSPLPVLLCLCCPPLQVRLYLHFRPHLDLPQTHPLSGLWRGPPPRMLHSHNHVHRCPSPSSRFRPDLL